MASNTNGRLRDGVLHLPPVDFIYDLFAAGPAALRAQLDRDTFTAHEIWPFVAAAIATQGTPGPHWFLVRMTEDFGQLESLLKSAALARGSSHLRRHLPSTIEGIAHLRLARQIPTWIQPVLDRRSKAEKARSKLLERVEKQSGTPLDPGMFKGLLESAAGPGRKVGDSLTALANGGLTRSEDARRYWIRLLAETAQTLEDVPGLTLVMHDGNLASAHTEARKALEFIDLAVFGPTVSTTTVSAATFSSMSSAASHGGRALDLANTTPMPSIGHEPRVLESVDIPRLLWALEWSNRSGRGPQRAADLARIVSEHAGIKFEPPNAARAFRRFKAHDTASTFWHENPNDSYTITPAGRAALSTATSTIVPMEKPKIR